MSRWNSLSVIKGKRSVPTKDDIERTVVEGMMIGMNSSDVKKMALKPYPEWCSVTEADPMLNQESEGEIL